MLLLLLLPADVVLISN